MRRLFELINKNLESASLLHFRQQSHNNLPIITISREKGSGGRPISYLVAKKLGSPWQVYHKDIVDEIAHEAALEREQVEEIDEARASIIGELLDKMFGKKMLTMNSYYKHLLHVLATIGMRGHAVIMGRGANFLFPNALKVRIVSPMDCRIRSMIKYEHVSLKEAQKRIKESDEEKNEFTKALFQHDQRDSHHYDIVIRTGENIDVEQAADMIVALAKKKFRI